MTSRARDGTDCAAGSGSKRDDHPPGFDSPRSTKFNELKTNDYENPKKRKTKLFRPAGAGITSGDDRRTLPRGDGTLHRKKEQAVQRVPAGHDEAGVQGRFISIPCSLHRSSNRSLFRIIRFIISGSP